MSRRRLAWKRLGRRIACLFWRYTYCRENGHTRRWPGGTTCLTCGKRLYSVDDERST